MPSPWIEAMRLRTLPVSMAGVLTACGYAAAHGTIHWGYAAVCMAFALLAQIASNFANEYFDFKAGIDTPGRDGPRRGVTEGDITPHAMLRATVSTLGVACLLGLSTVARGGWWLIGAGAVIAIGALAYSAGPFPLSRRCMGEVAVVLFYGIIPVNLTYYLQALSFNHDVLLGSVAVGLIGAQVILINNYRDTESDRAKGKHTLSSTLLGRRGSAWFYVALGVVASWLMWRQTAVWHRLPLLILVVTLIIGRILLRQGVKGATATKLLAATASTLLLASALMFAINL
jgi:1,4-dihydroxy-2-naphthoate octaprenyltransferase